MNLAKNIANAQSHAMQMGNHKRWVCGVLLVFTLNICCLGESASQDAVARAATLFAAGKTKQAESVLRAASAADPDSAALHGALGELLFNERRYEECIPELNAAVGMDPASRKNTILLAEALIATQRFGVAVDFLNHAKSRFGNYFQLHYDLGLAYYFMSKVTEAQGEFEEAYRLSPKFDRAELLIAACMLAKGNSLEAANLLRKLVKEHPTNAVYWGMLGRTLCKMGAENKAEALQASKRALALQPNDPHIQFDAGTVLAEEGEYAAARPILEHLEQASPEIVAVHVQLGRVYSRLGLPELARQESEIVAKLPKQDTSDDPLRAPDSKGRNPESR
jgi:predicted Zn-dependent protease